LYYICNLNFIFFTIYSNSVYILVTFGQRCRLVSNVNTALQLLYPPLMAISVGCILGLDNLQGLGDPAASLPGIPYP
jgi:hypothetical protein